MRIIAIATAVLAAWTAAVSGGQFRSRVESVRVDVLVTQDGIPVSGLTAGRLRCA